MTSRSTLDITTAPHGDAVVVRPVGLLDVSTAPRLRDLLLKVLADQPSAVIVDLDRLELRQAYTLSVFTVVARRTAEWSGVPLLLVAGIGAGSTMRSHTRAVARFVPVLPTVAAALEATRQPPVRRLTRLRLPAQPHAPSTARRLVAATCEVWDCPDLADDATAIASELVANAVTHAGGDAVLRLELRRDLLTVALRDGSPQPPVLRPGDGPPAPGGFGLRIVDALARTWGWAPTTGGGKVVWAVLRNPGARTPRNRRGG